MMNMTVIGRNNVQADYKKRNSHLYDYELCQV